MSEPKHPDENERSKNDEMDEGERRYVDDLVARGEVVDEGTEQLPPGATHEVVEEEDGVPRKVRRRRFSAQ